jgi:hypothetical protein
LAGFSPPTKVRYPDREFENVQLTFVPAGRRRSSSPNLYGHSCKTVCPQTGSILIDLNVMDQERVIIGIRGSD